MCFYLQSASKGPARSPRGSINGDDSPSPQVCLSSGLHYKLLYKWLLSQSGLLGRLFFFHYSFFFFFILTERGNAVICSEAAAQSSLHGVVDPQRRQPSGKPLPLPVQRQPGAKLVTRLAHPAGRERLRRRADLRPPFGHRERGRGATRGRWHSLQRAAVASADEGGEQPGEVPREILRGGTSTVKQTLSIQHPDVK